MNPIVSVENTKKKLIRKTKFDGLSLFYTLMLAILAVLVLYPLIMLLITSFMVELPDKTTQFGFGNWIISFDQPRMLTALENTFKRIIAQEIIVWPISIFLTWLLTRTDIPGKNTLDFLMWIAVFLPNLPILLGWMLLLDGDYGLVNLAFVHLFGLEKGPFQIYSFWGIVFAHCMAGSIATKYIFLAPAFRNLDSSFEEASRMSGYSSIGTLFRIVIPIMAPAIMVTFILSLIHSIESFEIDQVLGPPINFYVFSTQLFSWIRSDTPDFGPATVLSITILFAMLPLILLQQYYSKKRSYVTITGHFKPNVLRLGVLKKPAFIAVLVFMLIYTILPVIFLIMGTFMKLFGYFNIDDAWTLEHWQTFLDDPILLKSLFNTIKIAGGAAIIGMILYSLLAYISIRTKYKARGVIDFLTWVPTTIPGVILSLGMLWVFLATPFLRFLYGTTFILIIAVIVNSMTRGVQMIKVNMVQISSELEEASASSGGTWLYTFRRVIVPILAPAIVTVGVLSFISAARNVANIAMLTTNKNQPLSMLQLDYMSDGSFEVASIAGVLIIFLTIGVAFLVRTIGKRFGIHI